VYTGQGTTAAAEDFRRHYTRTAYHLNIVIINIII